ncbi:phage tail sheath family protein [Burkholderia cenocepacia]|nr:phage tail sheath family protein [Burkholderia cenocepacia]
MNMQWSEIDARYPEWENPGVHLAQQVMAAQDSIEWDGSIPVFLGWAEPIVNASSDKLFRPVVLNDISEWPTEWDKQNVLFHTVRHYFDNGGTVCYVVNRGEKPAEISADAVTSVVTKLCTSFLMELRISLVAIPQLTEWLADDAPESVASNHIRAWQALREACGSRRDLFFVLDAPREMTVARKCIEIIRDTEHRIFENNWGQHAAIYGPHLVTDYADLGLHYLVLPPCGAVLGLISRVDQQVGIWTAPANEELAHTIEPEYRETEARDWFEFSKPSMNVIRSFPGRGVRVWGCRTLATDADSPMRYVQVRRLLTYIEENLSMLCRFAVFESNDAMTWYKLYAVISDWLHELWSAGGLAGVSEEQAFQIQIGLNGSMTVDDVANGLLIIRVKLAVLNAAEFVEIQLTVNQPASAQSEGSMGGGNGQRS